MSVPAPGAGARPDRRAIGADVTRPDQGRDIGALLAAAAETHPELSDRAWRVYTAVLTLSLAEVDAVQVAAHLPTLTESQAGVMLGHLVRAGLLTKRLRVVGYKDGQRVRRSVYSLVEVTA
jgi:hypothetical protein